MLKEILVRIKQGQRTIRYPKAAPPVMPARFRGRPLIGAASCPEGCHACAEACPVGALDGESKVVDLGKCLFCPDCQAACPAGCLSFSTDHRLAVRNRGDLCVRPDQEALTLAEELGKGLKRLFGRSLKLRQVSAGGCAACEADLNVLGTIGWDLGRFGIAFVASPRHADGLIVTGPVTRNMELALRKTYEALAEPRIVIASGACAISGGPYAGHPEVLGSVDSVLPVDLYIPGCPPHPLTALDGLLRLLGRLEKGDRGGPAGRSS